ncbi:MAG: multidrug efflux SMR transporter [Pseudomonadota bacterium]
MPLPYLYLIAAIIAETIGTSFLQASEQFTRAGPTLMMVVTYGISFFFLGLALGHMPVGVAYAIWSGLGIVLITLIGRVVFGQRLDAAAMIGIALIVAGVTVLHLFSRTTAH